MRIGLLTSDLGAGHGWANYSLNLIRQLRAREIQTTVICARNSANVDIPQHPILPAVAPPERHSLIKMLRQLPRARALLGDCDILHCTIEPYAILAAAVAERRPLFITAHGSYVNLPRMRGFPVGSMYRRAFERAHLICVSRHSAQVARALMPNVRSIQLIHQGVDAARFAQPTVIEVEKTGPTVATLGEVKPRKGTLELVEAMAVVRERLPEAQCVIMGNPQTGSRYTTLVERRIRELGLEGNVKIMGFVDDDTLRAWLAAADVFALPSMNDAMYFEGFGLVVLEASAAGTAVVGTDKCGVADAIIDGVTGFVVAQDNIAEALPRALLALLEDPAKAEQMGAAGRKHANAMTWAAMADQVIALYQAALT